MTSTANRSWQPPRSYGTYQHKAITSRSRQLLMMGTYFPETCWAAIRREINNTKSDVQLVYLIHTESRRTVSHTSDLHTLPSPDGWPTAQFPTGLSVTESNVFNFSLPCTFFKFSEISLTIIHVFLQSIRKFVCFSLCFLEVWRTDLINGVENS